MAKIKQELGDIFKSHSDCTSQHYNGKKLINKAAMTKNMFIEVVSNLLTEREANNVNSENDNRAIHVVSNTEGAVCETCLHYPRNLMNRTCAECDDGDNWEAN